MMSMLCSLWDKISTWVTDSWTQLTFVIVVCAFGILGTMALLAFLKGPKFNKDKKPFKWGSLILCLLMYGLLALVCAARFARI